MESMAASLLSGDMDWMSLAGKMLSRLKEPPLKEGKKRNKTISMQIPSASKPRPSRKRTAQIGVNHSIFPATSFAVTVSQFEALRMQLLRQLVIYQKQLMALKIPVIPENFKSKKCASNINYHLNDQLAELYRNNRVLRGGKRMTVAETTPCNINKQSKPKKNIKRKLKSKKASHDLNKPNNISNQAEEMNACSSGQHFNNMNSVTLSNNMQFPYDKMCDLSCIQVPTQCTYYENNVMSKKCHNSKNKTSKKKEVASTFSKDYGNTRQKKENQNLVNKTCVTNYSGVFYTKMKTTNDSKGYKS